jgi:hypothetical protein
MKVGVQLESGIVEVRVSAPRWVKKDGRIKFDGEWYQSVYLKTMTGERVEVAAYPDPQPPKRIIVCKDGRFITHAHAERSI